MNNNFSLDLLTLQDLENKIIKNTKKIKPWMENNNISCYRIYNAEIPNFNFVIDKYNDFFVLQENINNQIDEEKSLMKIDKACEILESLFYIPRENIFIKERRRQKGSNQYEKITRSKNYIEVQEYSNKFYVNLENYLDTGIFLDHRITRKLVGKLATNSKNFLNLFSYTGSASVYAALNGAKKVTTVDISNTYLLWARKNFLLNNLNLKNSDYKFIKEDCIKWLENSRGAYDLIFVDPPTFSNSKSMSKTWDIERDQEFLFTELERILSHDGKIVFSTNKRNFKLNTLALNKLGLRYFDYTKKTTPIDFISKTKQAHYCWLISR
ncbi:MAG: class I SAM-dependent methyltransferase [Psittacicella sp.]